jgi:hypothetical protein
MPEVRWVQELRDAGLQPGDEAFYASISMDNGEEPAYRSESVGTFKTYEEAVAAVKAALDAKPPDAENAWWTGDVQRGSIEDQSFDDGDYGWVTDWQWEGCDGRCSHEVDSFWIRRDGTVN